MATFFKDISSVGFSKVLMIFFGLLTSVIIARTLGPEKNGIIASLLVFPSLFMSFGALGISQSSTYFLGRNLIEESSINKAVTHIWVFTSALSLIACFLLIYYFSNATDNLFLILLAIIPIPFSLFNTYNSGIFLGKNNIRSFNRIHWIPYLITTILVFFLVYVYDFDIEGVMIALIGGPFFIFIVLLLKNSFFRYLTQPFEWGVVKKLLGLGLIYALALLVINLNYRIDIIILDKMSTAYEVGIYAKGSIITQYLWQIPMLFSTVVFARSANTKNKKYFSLKVVQLLRISLIAVGLGSLVLLIFSDFIVNLLYGEAFKDSASVLRILIPGVIILTFYKVLTTDLNGRGVPWVSLKAMLPALVINVVLNIILIPKYGADGASFASTVSYSIAGLIFVHYYSKEVLIPIKTIFYYTKKDFDPIIKLITTKLLKK